MIINVEYSLMDPTKNMTILADTPVPVELQPVVAAKLMAIEPTAEQVGFLSWPHSAENACGSHKAEDSARDIPLRRDPDSADLLQMDPDSADLLQMDPDGADLSQIDPDCDIFLRMAGGEFCGNATMSAALRSCMIKGELTAAAPERAEFRKKVRVKVTGTDSPVEVEIVKAADGTFFGTVDMPRPLSVEEIALPAAGSIKDYFSAENPTGNISQSPGAAVSQVFEDSVFPVVKFEGISHVIIMRKNKDAGVLDISRPEAEILARRWCSFLGAEAMGLMFLDMDMAENAAESGGSSRSPVGYEAGFTGSTEPSGSAVCSEAGFTGSAEPSGSAVCSEAGFTGSAAASAVLTPLVFVPSADTIFWESACGSGSSAVGAWLASEHQKRISAVLSQPGGRLAVEASPDCVGGHGVLSLTGSVRCVYERSAEIEI